MAIKLGQSLKQQQGLMMTPQLQQAIKLLTLTHMEMSNMIAQEMVENPMLEESETEVSQSEIEQNEAMNKETTASELGENKIVDGKDEFDWDKYVEGYNSNSSSSHQSMSGDSEERPNYENMVTSGTTLAEHLEWQLRMEAWGEDEWIFLQQIIHNIDEDGYLEGSLEALIAKSPFDLEDALELLKMVQRLDPVGCGAKDLKDCLTIQARELPERSPLVEDIIQNHLELLRKKDYAGLAKVTQVTVDKIKDAEIIIHSFNPKPGRLIGNDETQYVVPDIYVRDVGGELKIFLNDEGVPRLRISNLYKDMLKQKTDEKAQEYVQDKLRSALWLIKSIENRQRTIEKVAHAIVKYQPEFFHHGPNRLKPMILKDIAAEIGMHESTVSRVTTNKYMHTSLGIFELKYFFNTGIGGKNGGTDIAGESLKIKIKQLIEAENPKQPFSDQKIVELLKMQDIEVARRTVTKYREGLGILSSAQRKK
ncbi:MAG: RNA polymerase factor sigma-54 [Bacteriovoracaceae bacterium]|nr:RNA polymerase factor sigma-54 [Bacteriovoracaceae bacterium]